MITEGTMTLSSEEAIQRLFREVNDLKYRMEAHTAVFSLLKGAVYCSSSWCKTANGGSLFLSNSALFAV